MRLRWLGPMVALALMSALLAGCGSDESDSADSGSPSSGTDAAFAASMTAHHMGGVELGQLAVDKAVDPEIKRIGQDIVDAQTSELELLESKLTELGAEASMPGPIEERDMMDMAALEAASVPEFDRLWLDVISAHHSAAIQMAEIEMAGGEDPELTELAGEIIDTQSRELTQFNELIAQMEG